MAQSCKILLAALVLIVSTRQIHLSRHDFTDYPSSRLTTPSTTNPPTTIPPTTNPPTTNPPTTNPPTTNPPTTNPSPTTTSSRNPDTTPAGTTIPDEEIKEKIRRYLQEFNQTTSPYALEIISKNRNNLTVKINILDYQITSEVQSKLNTNCTFLELKVEAVTDLADSISPPVNISSCLGDIEDQIRILPDIGVKEVNNCIEKPRQEATQIITDNFFKFQKYIQKLNDYLYHALGQCDLITNESESVQCYLNVQMEINNAQSLIPRAMRKAEEADKIYDSLIVDYYNCAKSETVSATDELNKQVTEVTKCAYGMIFKSACYFLNNK